MYINTIRTISHISGKFKQSFCAESVILRDRTILFFHREHKSAGQHTLTYQCKELCKWLCLLCGLLITTETAFAVQVANLYTAEVSITSQQGSERQIATQKGLGEVVVRVSGDRTALMNGWIKQALNQPDKYLKQFNFLTKKGLDTQGVEQEEQFVRLSFVPTLVNKLLREAGLPIWGENRPNLLLWLVQEKNSKRSILSSGDDSKLKKAIDAEVTKRGLPALFPLMDLEDKVSLSTSDAWGLFQERLESASKRYKPEAILAGKVYFTEQGVWAGRWLFIFNGEVISFNAQSSTLKEFPVNAVNRVADHLAKYYSINTNTVEKGAVKIVIKGIHSVSAYASVAKYIKKFAAVRDVFVAGADDDRLFLELVTEGQLSKLKEAIALDDKLVPEASEIDVDGRETLVFQWHP